MKKLLLIDGNNIMFRSYYATAATGNLMQNQDGVYTNGIYGFVRAFQQIFKMNFTHVMVALDAKGKTFRHDLFPEYKGTRKETPSELVMQFPLMREFLSAAGIPYFEKEKYEADDIIGFSAKHFAPEFDQILLISNDRDLMQLLDEKVSQLISKKGFTDYDVVTPSVMEAEMGIRPDQMTDYKGLVGDPSDNIPGVPGIGPKTAAKLLDEYKTLENVLANVGSLKGKTKEQIENNAAQAEFSKRLATIVTDFANDISIDKLEYHGPNEEMLQRFYQKMGFHSFLRKLDTAKQKEDVSGFKVIGRPEEIASILTSPVALHLEIFGSNYHIAQKLGFALVGAKGSYYIPYSLLPLSPDLQNWLMDSHKEKFVYDLKQTKVALLWDGYDLEGVSFDLMLSAYLLNPNMTKEGFREVVSNFDYLDVAYDEEVYGKGASYALPEDNVIARHSIDKAAAIFALHEKMLIMNKECGQEELLSNIEIPLASILAGMEKEGIAVDEKKLDDFGFQLKQRIDELETSIYELAGENFNINSPKQLGVILFEKLGLPYRKKNKTGYSTDISVLKELNDFHPIIDRIISYRTLTKLYSTYYEGLKSALRLKEDGRIHTIYKQALTQTGRLSSVEPNLQNIPVKTDEGKELRKVFIADPGTKLLSCDYSQIELRVLAEMADVEGLKEAFREKEDVHSHTAKLIFKNSEVSSGERRQAKAVNFGIIYGKTAWGLSEDLKISPKQAEKFIADYFDSFPEIKRFMEQTIEGAVKNGYVETLFHRRRYIPEIASNNYQTREFGKRMAMNAPIQGSAADILKIAMVNMGKAIKERDLKTKMLLQIHDEVVFSVPEKEKEKALDLIIRLMEHSVELSVPLEVESSFGNNLYEVK